MSDTDQLSEDLDEYEDDEGPSSGFRIRDPLPPPRAQQWSTADLHAFIHQGIIELNPPYQRDVVWPEAKQIGLIDSIFRNFYIPPVIFAIEKNEEGDESRVCVDGKQRLTSISKFMDGQVSRSGYKGAIHIRSRRQVLKAKPKKKYWYTRSETQSKSRLELPEPYKKQFQRKQITCVEYSGLVPGTERDIFQRVQLGMSLTAAEKLQAISSPLAEWVSHLQTVYVNANGGLIDHIKWDITRGRDFQGVAQLCYCCWHLPGYVTPSLPKVEKWLISENKPSTKFKSQVASVLQSFLYLATQAEYRQGFTRIDKRVAPVEFVFIGVLLAKLRECSWEERAEAVLALRTITREAHKDVRANERVMKSMWQFVERIKTETADPFEGWEAPGAEDDPPPKKKVATKRKRGDDAYGAPRPAPRTPRSRLKREPPSNGVPFVA